MHRLLIGLAFGGQRMFDFDLAGLLFDDHQLRRQVVKLERHDDRSVRLARAEVDEAPKPDRERDRAELQKPIVSDLAGDRPPQGAPIEALHRQYPDQSFPVSTRSDPTGDSSWLDSQPLPVQARISERLAIG